jgi:hypothetical protein
VHTETNWIREEESFMCEPSCFDTQKPARRGRALAALMTVCCLLGVAARAEEGLSKAKATHAEATRSAPPAAKAVRGNNPVTVFGFVGDGNAHGWPLYASVSVTADGFSSTAYTNPTTGIYSIELFEGVEYEFTVHALAGGYIDEVRTVTPPADPESQDFSVGARPIHVLGPGVRHAPRRAVQLDQHAGWLGGR